MSTHVISNIGSLVTCREESGQADLQLIERAAMVWDDKTVAWVGPSSELPDKYQGIKALDAKGKLVVPGLIDCHTHLAFGGWRTDEFEQRALGKGYLEIAKAGGGIASTVTSTRAASEKDLFEKASTVLKEMVKLGITTVECKSGYGLSLKDEIKLLRVYRALASSQPVHIESTLLAAHVVPAEYKNRRKAYIALVTDEIIPLVAKEQLARFCDVFVEKGAFTVREAKQIAESASLHGLRMKLHVDQLCDGGGAALAADVKAISADHLEYASEEGIAKMAEQDVVAVTLPFAAFNLRQPPMPARAFIDAGVSVAVSTDFNPGSAPSYHLPVAMYMACIMQRMSPAEVVKGATRNAAKAIGMSHEVGQLAPGCKADFALIDAPDVNQWMGHLRPNANLMTVIDGKVVYKKDD